MPRVNIAFVAATKAAAVSQFQAENALQDTPLPANILNALGTLANALANDPERPAFGVAVFGDPHNLQITMRRLPNTDAILKPVTSLPDPVPLP